MVKTTDKPDKLKPYLFHGVQLSWHDTDTEAVGTCPWCDKPKFSVNMATGLWQCFSCRRGEPNEGGNVYTFLKYLLADSLENTPDKSYMILANDRKLISYKTLKMWSIAKSYITNDWLIPGYNAQGKLSTLYRYIKSQKANGESRMMLNPTPTLSHQIFGMDQLQPNKKEIYLCEGLWDTLVLWETLGLCNLETNKPTKGKIRSSPTIIGTRLAKANVLGIPVANGFKAKWASLFAYKTVNLMAQNDHDRINKKTKKRIESTSYREMAKIARTLACCDDSPEIINLLFWNLDARYDKDLPSGYDVRDFLCS